MPEQFISVREAAQYLRISERKIMDLVDGKKLQAYRIAGQFIRFKKSDVLALKNTGSITAETTHYEYTPLERLKDFFYFNDFYIFSLLLILVFIYILIFYL